MSFWTGMKRMINGEPVFQPGDDPDAEKHKIADSDTADAEQPASSSPAAPTQSSGVALDASGHKVIPEVGIRDIECHISGAVLEVWITLHNHGTVPVFLDKMTLMGQKMELDYELAPGNERQSRVYRGPVPNSNAYSYADLYYRAGSAGDYFDARYFVEYHYEQDDNTYIPNDMTLQHPVRDV